MRPEFHPEYLVTLRFYLHRIVELHRLIDRSLQAASLQTQVRGLETFLEGKQATLKTIHEQVANLIGFSIRTLTQADIFKSANHDVRLRKQHSICMSSELTQAALVANERSLAYSKNFILNLMRRARGSCDENDPKTSITYAGLRPRHHGEGSPPPTTLHSSSELLPIQCFSLAIHKYVEAIRMVQDCTDKMMMHLSRKPRFARKLYSKTTLGKTQ